MSCDEPRSGGPTGYQYEDCIAVSSSESGQKNVIPYAQLQIHPGENTELFCDDRQCASLKNLESCEFVVVQASGNPPFEGWLNFSSPDEDPFNCPCITHYETSENLNARFSADSEDAGFQTTDVCVPCQAGGRLLLHLAFDDEPGSSLLGTLRLYSQNTFQIPIAGLELAIRLERSPLQ